MGNLTITDIDNGVVVQDGGKFHDETLTVAGAGTILAGTILARKEVADAVTVAANGGNTGNGTVTLATVTGGDLVPTAGIYTLECVTAVAHGGNFKLIDPFGATVAAGLNMTAGAGNSTVIEAAGMQFTITDAGTDFEVGDKFTLTAVKNGKLVPYLSAGAGGAQNPSNLLTYDVVATGAGDVAISAMAAGTFKEGRLIIDADGDNSNVSFGILDALRKKSLISLPVTQLGNLDNS